MSHISTVDLMVRDSSALETVCSRLGYECHLNSSAKMFDESVASGHVVKIPGWLYPVVIGTDGKCRFDNYNGKWGDVAKLNVLRQNYATEVAKRQAIKAGFRVAERRLQNGAIQLTCSK